MVHSIDIIHRRGPRNKMNPQLKLKKTVLAGNIEAKDVIMQPSTRKMILKIFDLGIGIE